MIIKIFRLGYSVSENSDEKIDVWEGLLRYRDELRCNGWKVLDIKEITGMMPDMNKRTYVIYELTCSKPIQ